MDELKNFISQFLEIINYQEDKIEFTNKFLSEVYLQAVDRLLKTLPADRQPLIIQHLESAKTPELLQQAVASQFDKSALESALQNTMQEMFADYLKTIEPALSDQQKTNLKNYFQTFQNPQNSA